MLSHNPMESLKGKVAVVTGGNSGLGKEMARLFAQSGVQVVITGRRKDALDAAVDEIGNGVVGLVADSAAFDQNARLVRHIRERFDGVDIYVANAGVITIAPTEAVTPDDYDRQFATNTRGVFFGVQAMLPTLRDGGAIILIGSLASTKVLENHTVYAGTKAAISAFARNWALELRSRRIRVNVLSPGPTDTAILGKLGISDDVQRGFIRTMNDSIPLGRMGQAGEIARAALFLASDAGSFINGIDLRVDGGMALV